MMLMERLQNAEEEAQRYREQAREAILQAEEERRLARSARAEGTGWQTSGQVPARAPTERLASSEYQRHLDLNTDPPSNPGKRPQFKGSWTTFKLAFGAYTRAKWRSTGEALLSGNPLRTQKENQDSTELYDQLSMALLAEDEQALQEAIFLRKLLVALGEDMSEPIVLYEDNVGVQGVIGV